MYIIPREKQLIIDVIDASRIKAIMNLEKAFIQ